MKIKKNEKENYYIEFSWKGNATVNIPIILALVGFFYAALLFMPSGCGGKYHDLTLSNKKELATQVLRGRIQKLRPLYDSLLPLKDSPSAKDQFVKIRATLQQQLTENYRLQYNNIDTNLKYYLNFFTVDRKSYYKALVGLDSSKLSERDTVRKVGVMLRDSALLAYDLATEHRDTLKIKKQPIGFVDFVSKYPNFGFWYVLSVAQMAAWFLIAILLFGSLLRTNTIYPGYSYKFSNAWLHIILPGIAVAAFAAFFYLVLIDQHVVTDFYFLDYFNRAMTAYSVPGYLVAIFCFSAYLFLSNKLELLDTPGNASVTEEQFKTLKSAFDFSFFCSAFILSVFVFYLGVLFHATNDIEALHFYSLLSGTSVIDYNYVYLVGLMHSILLAIFYIPVSVRFNSLQIAKEKKGEPTGGAKKFFKALFDSAGSILVTLSPLLATVVEKLVNALLG